MNDFGILKSYNTGFVLIQRVECVAKGYNNLE